jgi:hypothetical protein
MDPANYREALREAAADEAEGKCDHDKVDQQQQQQQQLALSCE